MLRFLSWEPILCNSVCFWLDCIPSFKKSSIVVVLEKKQTLGLSLYISNSYLSSDPVEVTHL